jgi:cytochrome P450
MDRAAVERGRGAAVAAAPPGPPATLFSRLLYWPGRDPLAFFTGLARTYGDVVRVRLGPEDVWMLSDPAAIRDVLVTNQRFFAKGRGLERARRLLGDGLLTSEAAVHVRQRRLMQPAFHRDRIASYGEVMTTYADRVCDGWSDGDVVDVAQEMNRLTLAVVGKTLFDADVEQQAREVGDAMNAVMASFWTMMLPLSHLLERLPIPVIRRSRRARERLDAIIYGMIADRRRHPGDRGDLLSMLLLAQDEEGDGGGMSDQQVRDEAMTIFLAGHETTANALAWTWALLSGAPDVEARLHEELDRVLGGRLPTVADLPSLAYVERVVTESMRLYPPAWIVGRRALRDYAVAGYTIPARAIVILCPYVVHRDPRLFPDPERFDPDRWTPEFRAALPPFAYFPFGGGSRRCIGESFAWMELSLVVAAIARRWTLRVLPDHPVVPQPVVTLRLKHGLKVALSRRSAS